MPSSLALVFLSLVAPVLRPRGPTHTHSRTHHLLFLHEPRLHPQEAPARTETCSTPLRKTLEPCAIDADEWGGGTCGLFRGAARTPPVHVQP